ncbi:MAG: FecR family protein [Bacteroidota bacterium]|nr:FecR family protein [Bacteroidota bacterium]
MDTIDLNIIVRFLQEECSEQVTGEVELWIKSSPDNQKLFDQYKKIWDASLKAGIHLQAVDIETELQKYLNQIDILKDHSQPKLNASGNNHLWGFFLRVAAIILIIVNLGILAYQLFPKQPAGKKGFTQMSVANGSKSKLVLPDSSIVWLNSGSKISYDNDYNKHNREIHLDGEAYFEVAKNRSKPFLVKTPEGFTVRAVGTAFNVKCYKEDKFIETALVEGAVKLIEDNESGQKNEYSLKPNEIAKFDKKLRNIVILNKSKNEIVLNSAPQIIENKAAFESTPHIETIVSWKDQHLAFDHETFDGIVNKLERWYGFKIHLVDNNLNNDTYTGTFQNNETIFEVLNVLEKTSPIQYSIKEREIYIKTKP